MTLGATICAWCLMTLKAGDPTKPVSHGICPDCAERLAKEAA